MHVGKHIDGWVRRAQTQKEEVTEDGVVIDVEGGPAEVTEFSSALNVELTMCCVSTSHTVDAVSDGNGLNAKRSLMNRYEPRSALTKRACLKPIITPKGERIEHLEPNFL